MSPIVVRDDIVAETDVFNERFHLIGGVACLVFVGALVVEHFISEITQLFVCVEVHLKVVVLQFVDVCSDKEVGVVKGRERERFYRIWSSFP